jgi:hypothetical protein
MALVTTDEIKKYIFGSTSGSTYDTLLSQLITQVTALIEKETGIRTTATSYDTITNEIVNSDGTTRIKTKLKPIRTLTKIERRDANNDWEEYVDETLADIDFSNDKIYTQYLVASQGFRNLRLSYTVGYKTAETPEDLKLATILIIAGLFNARNTIGFSSHSILGLNVNMKDDDYHTVKKILTKYKTVMVI